MSATEKSPLKEKPSAGGDNGKFNSKAGVLTSCLGNAIGTGNIWRFPRMVALNSGRKGALCFILPWMMFLFIWSIPMLVIEYATGRHTGKGVVSSMQQLAGDKAAWLGMWIAFVNFMISCWYSVIMGWCLFYTYQLTFYPLPITVEDSENIFYGFAQDSYWPALTQFIAIIVTSLLLIKGVRVIEIANLFLVPLLLLLVTAVFIWSLTRRGAMAGVIFFFTPDWETLASPQLWIDAASQNAFDCGAGWGLFIAYATFMTVHDPIVKYSIFIPLANNVISLICGILTFSTAFSSLPGAYNATEGGPIIDVLQTAGPASTGLTFIWLPVLFATAGTAGRVFASLFLICLVMAATSSLMGTLENVIQVFTDYGVRRLYAVTGVVSAAFIVGLGSSLNLHVLTNQDFTWAYALLVSGLFLQYMVIQYGVAAFRDKIVNAPGTHDWRVPVAWDWIIRVVAPLQAVIILSWWIIDNIVYAKERRVVWYSLGETTLMVVMLQWLGALLILAGTNILLFKLKPAWFTRHSYTPESQQLTDKDPVHSPSDYGVGENTLTLRGSVDNPPLSKEMENDENH